MVQKMKQACLGITCALASWLAHAGSIYQAQLVAIPQMQVKAGKVLGCGFQLKAAPTQQELDGSYVMLDTSFILASNGITLMKGGAVKLAVKNGSVSPSNLPIQAFWAKVANNPATTPLNDKAVPSESPGYLMYGADFSAGNSLIEAMLDDARIMIGVRIKGEPVERIYSGEAKASEEEKQQVSQCIVELVGGMQREIDARTK